MSIPISILNHQLSARLDLHNFRASSVRECNPVAHVRGQQRLAERRNPTDCVSFEIEFVDTDDGKRFCRAFFILHRRRCAERDAVGRRVWRIDNMDRCQNLVEFADTLADGVCHAKFLQFVAQTLRSARGDVIGRSRRQSRRRSFPSAALRKIHILFNKRPTHRSTPSIFLIETRSPPGLLAPTLAALPSMSLIPFAPFLLFNSYLVRCVPSSPASA